MLIENPNTLDLKNWKLKVDKKNILWVKLDCLNRSTNILAKDVRLELEILVNHFEITKKKYTEDQVNISGIVFYSEKITGFCAGADVNEFIELSKNDNWLEQSRKIVNDGWHLYNKLESLSKKIPTIAMIKGFCFGGALELSLACRYIIAIDDPKTSFALPEVQLGIYPGWGGVKRLPEKIGPINALNAMLTGKSFNAKKAFKSGLADLLVNDRVANASCERLITVGLKKKELSIFNRILLGPLKTFTALIVTKQLEKKIKKEHYPAPFGIIDLWKKSNGDPTVDVNIHDKMLGSETASNLLRVYILKEKLKKLNKESLSNKNNDKSSTIEHVHVIGAGTMGGDIAIWCALQGLKVTVQDISYQQIARVIKKSSKDIKRKFSNFYDQKRIQDKIIPDFFGDGVSKADVIIEAATENLDAKKNIFSVIEKQAKENALICSNTSSIKIEDISSNLKDPNRIIGVHFFNPVAKMPLVEIIKTENSDANFLKMAFNFVHKIKKLPLPVKSSPGFLVNAVLVPYLVSAMRSVDSGIKPEEIDSAMKSWGMPMGPIELIDLVGLDIILAVGNTMDTNESSPKCLKELTDKKLFGKKSGQGFYKWKNSKKIISNKILLSDDEKKSLAENLIYPLIDKTKSLVEEGIVEDKDLADAGVIFGTGFAPFRGGPIHYSETSIEK